MTGGLVRRGSLPFIVIVGLLVVSSIVPAVGQWTSTGPDGGWVAAIAINPETPSTLYAATERGGVYKSTDDAASWRLMNNGFPPVGFENAQIRDMAIDPSTPETLYLGTTNGVFKATDGANSWAGQNEGLPANVRVIAGLGLDPSNPSTLFIGTGLNRLYRSTDAAASWQQVVDGAPGSISAVAVAPSNSLIVYRGTGINTVFKSTDGGDNWSSVSTGLDNAFVFNQITVHPTNPDIVYAATDNGLFKTTNGGTSWATLNTPETVVESVVLDPSNSATVYAVSDGVMKSSNGGGSWSEVDDAFSGAQLKTIAVDPGNSMTLYTGASVFEALFKSTDGGTNWASSNCGLSNIQVTSIAFDPQNPSTLYATSAFGGGVHKSEDGGLTWESKRDSVLRGFQNVLDVVVDPLDSSNVYLGTEFSGGIFWSDDAGESWNAANKLVTVFELGIHPTSPSTLFAAHQGGVYRSTDRARTWTLLDNGLPTILTYASLAVDPTDGDTVYAGASPGFGGGEAGVYKTTNRGNSWVEMSTGLELLGVSALEIAPSNPSILYAGGPQGKIQKSTDSAANGMMLDTGISAFDTVTDLAIDPFNSSVVYAGTLISGVLKTADGGATWTESNPGLPHPTIQALAIIPTNPKQVLAAPYYYSVFRYQSLSPQWLFAAGDPAGIGALFDGVALSNYSGKDAAVGLEAIGDSTSGKAAGQSDLRPLGGHQQVDLDLLAGEQFADLRGNIFEGDVTLPAWIELTSDNPDIASFFQFGSGTLTQLDGGVAIENLATKFYFQRVFDGPATYRGQAATTRLTVLNPNDEEVTVDLSYFPPEDGPLGQPRQATRKIPARSFLDETASDVFGTSISGGYVAGEVTEGGGVAAFEVVQLSDRPMVLGLNASTGNSSTRSFSAQVSIPRQSRGL